MMENSVNKLVAKIAARARELADMSLPQLRLTYPAPTDNPSEIIRYCVDAELSRGEIIEAILLEEFSLEFDAEYDS